MRPFLFGGVMNRSFKSYTILGLFVLLSCDTDENTNIDPLVGTYQLQSLLVQSDYVANGALDFYYTNATLEVDTLTFSSGESFSNTTLIYTNNDNNPVFGDATLNADGSAVLAGSLPANIGTDCSPLIAIAGFASDGTWAANEDSTFILELDYVLAPDIYGSYSYNLNTGVFIIDYTLVDNVDTVSVDSVFFNNQWISVERACVPTSSNIYRILTFIRE